MLIRKKFSSLLVIGLALVLVGLGCKGLSSEEQAAISPVTLEYWTVVDDVDEITKLVSEFTATRSHIKVNVRQLANSEVYSRFLEALAEDNGPDIISVNSRELPAYLSKLSPMPASVTDILSQTIKKQFSTETQVRQQTQRMPTVVDIDREYVQAVGDDVVIKGDIYGLPLSLDTLALYYNKDLLDRAGVATPPKTWKEFQEAVKKLTKSDKDNKVTQAGAAMGLGDNIVGFDDMLYVLFRQSGVDFTNDNGQAIFNAGTTGANSQPVSAVDFYSSFADPSRDVYSWNKDLNNSLDSFVNGSLAFFFGYSYHRPIIKARAPQMNFEVLPLLQLNPARPVNVASYWVQTVPKKSEHKDQAWALIDFLTHSKATETYLDNSKRPAALRAHISGQLDDTDLSPFASQVLVAETWYKGKNYSQARQALSDLLTDWLRAPATAGPNLEWKRDALNRAASRINQTL